MPKKSDNAGKPRKTPGAKTPVTKTPVTKTARAKIPSATPRVVKPRTAAPRSENPHRSGFNPGTLDSSIIALPLLKQIQEEADRLKEGRGGREGKAGKNKTAKEAAGKPAPSGAHDIIIDLNMDFPGGRAEARKHVMDGLARVMARLKADPARNRIRDQRSDQYVFGTLEARVLRELVSQDRYRKGEAGRMDAAGAADGRVLGNRREIFHSIYRVWPDFKVRAFIDRSVRTVKADAARYSFSAEGKGVVWAVMDSGIQADHVHFALHGNLDARGDEQFHKDFTGGNEPLRDEFGHGTHVAGIIAGEIKGGRECAYVKQRDENGEIAYMKAEIANIAGMAPRCALVSLKVLDGDGGGQVSNLIAALDYVQEVNAHGRRLRIHGVNMSLGYEFDPEWFACGQSPLCVEVDRLVRSGVVVVVAAGNTGYAYVNDAFKGTVASGMDLSINDPGNADLAITVGATHKDSPHIYGVSYFSSKGPTGDGRLKPELVAPGEKILSCAAGRPRDEIQAETGGKCAYREHSGTSMAAPHVSGVVAAFMSVRQEFIGRPEKIKAIFTGTATDLKRERYFQGSGLVDLMRAIQSV